MLPKTSEPVDIAVVGAGPAGLVAALALARAGAEVVLVGPLPSPAQRAADTRTAALFEPSIALLANLGLWPALAAGSAPIAGIRLIDDTGHLLRAPELHFRAAEVGLEAFGCNVPNRLLLEALLAVVPASVDVVDEAAIRVETGEREVVIETESGRRIVARLAVAADGRASLTRAAAGIAVERWTYPQRALATGFAHTAPHNAISSELHRANGPLTTVPMPGDRSSLVWVDAPDEVERLAALADHAFAAELDQRLMGLLGKPSDLGRRASFPLEGLAARRLAARRVALVGEAAHVLPPIGAQGLNLGLRDIGHLAGLVEEAMCRGSDPGARELLDAYEQSRRGDVGSRTLAVDLLNRSLISGLLPTSMVRGLGLHALIAVPGLRQALMREGLGLGGALPEIMRRR